MCRWGMKNRLEVDELADRCPHERTGTLRPLGQDQPLSLQEWHQADIHRGRIEDLFAQAFRQWENKAEIISKSYNNEL